MSSQKACQENKMLRPWDAGGGKREFARHPFNERLLLLSRQGFTCVGLRRPENSSALPEISFDAECWYMYDMCRTIALQSQLTSE